PRHADRDHTRSLAQAAVAPFAGEDLARDARRAEALRHAVDIDAFEAVGLVPFIAAESFAPVVAVGAFEAIDALAMLEPLHHAVPLLLTLRTGAAPRRRVVRIGMPIPHATTEYGIVQPRTAFARLDPADLDGVGFVGRTFAGRHQRELLRECR